MTRKIVNNTDPGNATTFGGDDTDQINKYLTGVDQSGTDPVTIATTTTFKDGKLVVRNPADTFSSIIKAGAQITSDKTFTLPVTASDTIDTIAATATLTNKTIDAAGTGNVLTGVSIDPLVKRTGFASPVNAAAPSATNMMTLGGTLASMAGVGAGTNTMTYDTTEGLVANFVSTATGGLNIGLISPASTAALCRTVFGGKVRARFKIDTAAGAVSRVWFGLVGVNALPISDTPMASAVPGILVGFGSADTNYQIYQNDNVGTVTVTPITGSIAKNTSYHTIEINWPAGGASVNVIFDGTLQNLTTNIPLTTSDLWLNCVGQTVTAAIRTLSIHSLWAEFDK